MTAARTWLLRATAASIVTAAAATGAWVLGSAGGTQSDPITGPWDTIGGRTWLLPDLDHATVIVPDRPHARREVDDALQGRVALDRTRTYALSTNSWRLRGGALPEKQGRRIAVVGDSVAMGHGVDDEQAWPALLAGELSSRGQPTDVLNAGCPAAGLDTMESWCTQVGPQLDLDMLIWARRGMDSGTGVFRQHVERCQSALGIPVLVVLHPTSGFDLRALREADREAADLDRVLSNPVLDLNPLFRQQAAGRGHRLTVVGDEASLLDPSGQVLASGPRVGDELPAAIYEAFEDDTNIAEALFFDGAHPDVEGNALYATAVADFIQANP